MSIQVPIEVSARHVHLSQKHLEQLFGQDYSLQRYKELSQPGQFAAIETVTLKGPKAAIDNVRVMGPCREATQAEISLTDARTLGIEPPVRKSGQIEDSAGVLIEGPKGKIELKEGLIAVLRHLHADRETADSLKLNDGDAISVKTSGLRSVIFNNVIVRVDDDFRLAMHIDTDEANCAGINSQNCQGEIVRFDE